MRKEKDALGEVLVPEDRYYGAQTQRACDNFCVGDEPFPKAFIQAHALVKQAAASVNEAMGLLDGNLAAAIRTAADEVISGKFDDQFPLVIWQSGSGTQTNMNVNEVIANRANEILGHGLGTKSPVHPNDHVNCGQSTNDTVPTSMHIACVVSIREVLLPAILQLEAALREKAEGFSDIVKIGRTHLQDATPLTLGQEFSGYVAQLHQSRCAIEAMLPELQLLVIGGTAVGTGLNTQEGFDQQMADAITRSTGYEFGIQENKFAGLAAHDAVVRLSGVLKSLAGALIKIANDIRWLGSGPRSGLGELDLPANEPGSSIMPGKVNPTQCEMVTMVCCRVFGNDLAISMAGSQGNFELNVFKPLMAHGILQSIQLLADASVSFASNCVAGIEPNAKRIGEHVENSLMLVTALNQHIGYDRAAEIAIKAWREDKSLRATALELGYVAEDEFDGWVRPESMIAPSKRS
jgi:fumarate hydratase, class II